MNEGRLKTFKMHRVQVCEKSRQQNNLYFDLMGVKANNFDLMGVKANTFGTK